MRQPTAEELQEPPSRQHNTEKVEQHLIALLLHLQGISDPAAQEVLGIKHLRSAQHSIKRGEQIAKDLGLDTNRVRLKVAAWFEELTEITTQTVRDQVVNGTLVEMVDGGTIPAQHLQPRENES